MLNKVVLPYGYPDAKRSKFRLNTGWRFHLGDVPGAMHMDYNDSTWDVVTIPHTLKLTSLNLDGCDDDKTQPTFHRDIGWYRNALTVDADPLRKVFLEFEGAHQVTDAWVNGQHVGQHAIGGYTPFHFDVTPFVNRQSPNIVALRVDNRKNPDVPPDPGPFDYIKFSGLYREVYLVQTEGLYIPFA
ncbi:MAG: glycoside hydrolase family 2, partial [Anaerolineales bacterium]